MSRRAAASSTVIGGSQPAAAPLNGIIALLGNSSNEVVAVYTRVAGRVRQGVADGRVGLRTISSHIYLRVMDL